MTATDELCRMSAIDELRRLLDERGVEWLEGSPNKTKWHVGGIEFVATNAWPRNDATRTKMVVHAMYPTPEQAVEATLERWTCKLDDFADVPFSVDYEIEGYDMGSSRDYATLAECSECGAYIIVPPEYHHVLTCDGDEVYQPYRFCPNCGRKVVGA